MGYIFRSREEGNVFAPHLIKFKFSQSYNHKLCRKMVTSKDCFQKANTDTWLTSLSVIQIILERSLVEKRSKQTNWGCERNMSIYVYLLWRVSMFGLWFENILETWNCQILIKYIAPWKETLFCRCHLVYKGKKKKKSLYWIIVLLLCLFAIGDVFTWRSSLCPKSLLIMRSVKLKGLQRDWKK